MVQSFTEYPWSPGISINIHDGAAGPQDDMNSALFFCQDSHQTKTISAVCIVEMHS